MDNLVLEASNLITLDEQLKYLAVYFNNNHFTYNCNISIEDQAYKNSDNYNVLTDPNRNPDQVFIRKTGVCTGYAQIVYDYLERLGYPCIKIIGTLNKTGETHEWCVVYASRIPYTQGTQSQYDWWHLSIIQEKDSENIADTIKIKSNEEQQELCAWDFQYEQVMENLKMEYTETTSTTLEENKESSKIKTRLEDMKTYKYMMEVLELIYKIMRYEQQQNHN